MRQPGPRLALSVSHKHGRALLALSLSWLCLAAPGSAAPATTPCALDPRPHLVVVAEQHRLSLCEQQREVRSFSVRLARNGLGKRRSGDGKLPLGRYPLGTPQASARYGTFIPIGYPTSQQRGSGYTGGDIGVHGPDRRVRWLGSLVNLVDTTNGCVGIATDGEMKDLVAWISEHHAALIDLQEASP